MPHHSTSTHRTQIVNNPELFDSIKKFLTTFLKSTKHSPISNNLRIIISFILFLFYFINLLMQSCFAFESNKTFKKFKYWQKRSLIALWLDVQSARAPPTNSLLIVFIVVVFGFSQCLDKCQR